jgi:1A family penicillin-binding protein
MRQRLIVGAIVAMTVCGWYTAYRTVRLAVTIAGELDRANELTNIADRARSTIVMDRRGRPAFAFYSEQRIDISIDQVSPHMVQALVAVEDRRFYSHYGLDPIRIVGAAMSNLRAGRITEGGSTITQQLARAVRLSPARTFERKVREAMLALRLEERYSKAQILQEYLNTVYFGEGFYGVEAASRGYFGKPALALAPAEAALLAGLVRAPSRDAPCVSVERATGRRNLVLRRMHAQGRISAAELAAALRAPLPTPSHDHGTLLRASGDPGGEYFQEEVRRQLVTMFGSERVLRGGLRVYSTYDPLIQQSAELAIRTRVAEIAKARPRAKDLQGSLVAIDPKNGDILALVGGRNYQASSFNRATQARRQAGSAFKPIIYAAALERGYAPGSLLRNLDTPISASEGAWLPVGEHENSEYTLRQGLKVSSNRAAAQLLQLVGVRTAVDYAHRLGIASDLPLVPSLALGTGEVTLLELTSAYGVFANQGLLAAPRFLTRVEECDGAVIWSSPFETSRAISQTTAFLMSSMLADVVSSGTATGARAAGFTLPAGGKTGTTDDYSDAWFVGYTPHLVAGVWFGLDTPAPIMNRGFASVVAVPAWARFMKAATAGAKPDWYQVPSDVEKVAICRLTGARAADGCRHPIAEAAELETAALTGINAESWPALVNPLPLPAVPAEPNVYEDYFPVGKIPFEVCVRHSAVAESAVGTSGVVPASLPTPAVVIERDLRSDGTTALTLKRGGG